MTRRQAQFLIAILGIFSTTLALPFGGDDDGLSSLQEKRIEQITSFFENSTVDFQYAYIENLHDGRGYTAGRVGFCTGTGDLIQVVRLYCGTHPRVLVCQYLPRLEEINQAAQNMPNGNPDVSGLEGFTHSWRKAAEDPAFRDAQDALEKQIYFQPAMKHALDLGIRTPIGKAIFYDTIVQHGEGDSDDPDSMMALVDRTQAVMKFTPEQELQWLDKFLDVRRNDLLHPANQDSQEVWSKSVKRVDKLRSIMLIDGNVDLDRPVKLNESNTTD